MLRTRRWRLGSDPRFSYAKFFSPFPSNKFLTTNFHNKLVHFIFKNSFVRLQNGLALRYNRDGGNTFSRESPRWSSPILWGCPSSLQEISPINLFFMTITQKKLERLQIKRSSFLEYCPEENRLLNTTPCFVITIVSSINWTWRFWSSRVWLKRAFNSKYGLWEKK